MVSDARRASLERFVEEAARAMVARGWEADPERHSGADSIFLGVFRQPIGAQWLATVEFICEGGPVTDRIELGLTRVRSSERLSAIIGGELGLRHAPTARLLSDLDVVCEAHIMRDLEDVLEDDEGGKRPVISDDASAGRASEELVAVVDAHALQFARRYADVDRVLAFIAEGEQTSRDPEFEYVFVPALLAASGRCDDARAALRDYRERPKSSPAEEEQYQRFADDLGAWIDNHPA
jgi:hypothetical protein